MDINNQKDQISNDQFGDAENTQQTPENNVQTPLEQPNDEEAKTPETEVLKDNETDSDAVVSKGEESEVVESKKSPAAEKEAEDTASKDEEDIDNNGISLENEEEDEDEEEFDDDDEALSDEPIESVDYSEMTRQQLVDKLAQLIQNKSVSRVRADIESIKVNFYKKHKADLEKKRKEWVDAGGAIEEFEAPEDLIEPQIKELLKQYRDKKADYNRNMEEQKVKNLEAKQSIIEQIKELVNRNESVNQTFQDFRDLQQKWREIGPVPQLNLNDLWETYHHHVQNFYDYVKINKELKDLDLKRNHEEKILLCEKAEELLLESSIINAFKKLQKLHNQWREVGPVLNEHRTEIWERFKNVTSTINKKHQEHFEGLRDEQKSNLDAKIALCENAEELAAKVISSTKDWNTYSKEMIDLQKVWKTIGFAPKKDNNRIYERFRAACDSFFNNKREFYRDARENQLNNLQLKTELCMQAEAIKESTEWKKTSDELVNLQKRWKEIGPVPRKHSDELWKRFRAACDFFFEHKAQHFSQVDGKFLENLKLKEELIVEVEKFELTENVEENLKKLKEFQRRWAEIGFVPIKKKDELQRNFREAINKHFDSLKIDNSRKNILRFKSKIDTIQGNPRQENKIRQERDKLFNKLKQVENDIVLWENNIGFFAKSKNAEQLIQDVERKIEKARAEMKVLEEKIRLIDSMEA